MNILTNRTVPKELFDLCMDALNDARRKAARFMGNDSPAIKPSSVMVTVSPVLTDFRNSSPSWSIAITLESSQIFASTIPLAASESMWSANKNAAGLMPIEHTV